MLPNKDSFLCNNICCKEAEELGGRYLFLIFAAELSGRGLFLKGDNHIIFPMEERFCRTAFNDATQQSVMGVYFKHNTVYR